MSNEERRTEPRVRSKGMVTLVAEGVGSAPANIFDVSPSGLGMGLEASIGLVPGTAVAIDGAGFTTRGVVRFCYPMSQTFRIGVELKPLEPA